MGVQNCQRGAKDGIDNPLPMMIVLCLPPVGRVLGGGAGDAKALGNTFPNLRTMRGRVALCGTNSNNKYNGHSCSWNCY